MFKAERVTGAFLQGWSRDAVSWSQLLAGFLFLYGVVIWLVYIHVH